MTITLQASLLCKPSIPQLNPLLLSLKPSLPYASSPQLSLRRRINGASGNSFPFKSRLLRHRSFCTLNSEDLVDSAGELSSGDALSESAEVIELNHGPVLNEAGVGEGEVRDGDVKKRLPIVVFLMGVFARLRDGFEKLLYSDWFSWWPFWRQEKRLERLIAEADANPKDAAKQSALLAELNKHRSLSFFMFFLSVMVLNSCGNKITDR